MSHGGGVIPIPIKMLTTNTTLTPLIETVISHCLFLSPHNAAVIKTDLLFLLTLYEKFFSKSNKRNYSIDKENA